MADPWNTLALVLALLAEGGYSRAEIIEASRVVASRGLGLTDPEEARAILNMLTNAGLVEEHDDGLRLRISRLSPAWQEIAQGARERLLEDAIHAGLQVQRGAGR